ncbi:MAG: fasciclin domain-containing protein [Bacteroidota bacterium]
MKKLSYSLSLFLCLVLSISCEKENTALPVQIQENTNEQMQLPEDAPDFVVELYDYLLASMDDDAEVEGRSDDLSVYEYLCFKPDLSIFKTVIDAVPGLRLILSNPVLPVTVFAPTNQAFADFLAANGFASLDEVPFTVLNQVVANHILLGRKDVEWLKMYMKTLAYADCDVRGRLDIYTEVIDANTAVINGMVNIIRGNQFVGRGFVHVVDKVIAPSTLVDFATSDPRFSTLVEALTCPNLGIDFLGALTSEGGVFTIFAPTNDAFADLASALGVSSVCEIPAETLTTVLAYHVKAGASLYSSQLTQGRTLKTLAEGLTLDTALDGTTLTIIGGSSTANVVIANVQANNGMIHAIDTVLLP